MQRYDKKAMGLILFSREAMPLFLSQKLIMFLEYSKIASFHSLWDSHGNPCGITCPGTAVAYNVSGQPVF